ncbi:hypothetical protein cyc_04087 [Cyclospora cayetanensis]|uniref:Peptidase n=1 Tax=Cyclospora cayetanensis TaxID=88456 RepID=A0A1D3CZD2_9EIME|nr:hypothetical protein cyc_04087 [Cyclospora cayetanensis]
MAFEPSFIGFRSVCMLLGLFLLPSLCALPATAENTVITGTVLLPPGHAPLPDNSHFRVELSDITLMDAPKERLAFYTHSAVEGVPLTYELVLPQEVRAAKEKAVLSVSAVVHVGWEPQEGSSEWIRLGDYYSDMTHVLELSKGGYDVRDFNIKGDAL